MSGCHFLIAFFCFHCIVEGASEKYFFHCRVTRWATGSRWKRATKDGFWKASGKEVPIFCSRIRSRTPILVGSKRIQVFYLGKAPAGQRTEWVLEEYRLAGAGLGPYRAVPPSRNQNLGQTSCITYVEGKVRHLFRTWFISNYLLFFMFPFCTLQVYCI